MNNTAEMTVTDWKRECPEAYAACKQIARERLLADPEFIWSALSKAGATCGIPSTSEQAKTYADFQATRIRKSFMENDECRIGQLLGFQVAEYLEYKAEEWVADNWREWV